MSDNPKLVLLFSGKRKSGKDYITGIIHNYLGKDKSEIIRISQPIKAHWAAQKSLDLEQLLSDGEYKESFRKDMIEWSDRVRNEDYGYFCKVACQAISKPICIVSDIRRNTDIKWFLEKYGAKVITIRINCSKCIRESRGWKFTEGVDDVASECDLDNYENWDFVLVNNNETTTEELIQPVIDLVKKFM